jgi:prophage DNA circulation protein|tara:strand:+ start:679 stop:1893 length:1215 start_codon:yes stop_codon:yes gene_type:complete
MIDIDPDIEKQISLIQEEKLNSKLKEDIKKVVKVAEQPTEKLVDFFSVIADEKKQTKERVAKSEKKIANIEELFSSLKKEKKKAEPKKQKELLLKPEEEVKEKEQTVSEVLQDELEPIGSDTSIIGQVTKKLSEMKVANELDKEKLKTLDRITSLDEMKKEFVRFKEVVTKQMGSIGGGGEVNLAKLDDVDTDTALIDKRVLQYDGTTGKFVGTTLETEDLILDGTDASGSNAGDRLVMDGTDSSSSNAGDGVDLQDGTFGAPALDLSAVDQDILPDTNNARNLGSATKRWNDLFLAGDTIDLAGATISSDGTGSISIAATGATLPAGSKAGTNPIAIVSSSGETLQPATLVPFFTASEGLNTKNTDFEFNSSIDTRMTFTGTKTFTLASGNLLTDSDTTIFQF